MNIIQLDRLSRQSQHKSQTISKLINQISCLKSILYIQLKIDDIQTQKQLTQRIQLQKEQLKKQINTLKNQLQQYQYQQQNTQNRYLLVLQKLQQQVQQGKKKFNKLNNKISPLIDHDTIRLTIMTQLSQQHQLEIQKYKHQLQTQKDHIHKLTRQKTLLEHKLQTNKIDYDQKIRQLTNTIKNQSSQTQLTALSLQMSKDIENRLKLSYQTLKKQADYYKQKYFMTQKKYQDKIYKLEKQLKQLKSQFNNNK